MSGVVVYKSPEAGLIGQGLAGTVDMRTIRPLEHGERVVATNARYEWNEKGKLNPDAEDTGHRFSATYVDQFMDDTLGVVLGYAKTSTPTQSERYNAWGYPTTADGELIIGGSKPFNQSNLLERDGYIGTLEYSPSDTFTTSLDVFYSDFTERQILRGIELPLQWSSATLQPGYVTEGDLVTEGTFTGVTPVVRNDINDREAQTLSIGWHGNWQIADNWELDLDLSQSKVERSQNNLESYSGVNPRTTGLTDTVTFRTEGEGDTTFTPTIDWTDPSIYELTDPQGWGAGNAFNPVQQAGFINAPSIDDELNAIRADLKRHELEFGPVSYVKFGASFTERTKEREIERAFLTLGTDAAGDPITTSPIPDSAVLGIVPLDFIGFPGIIAYDTDALIADGTYVKVFDRNQSVVLQEWGVEEKVTTGYVQFGIDSNVGEFPLTGNFGLQVVHTDQSSTGSAIEILDPATAPDPTAPFRYTDIEDGVDYTKYLPSLNLSLEVSDNMFVRFAASRTLARARMDDMRISSSLSFDPTRLTSTDPAEAFFSRSGGNPLLRPYMANSIDLSFEKYFGSAGYVSVAAFYRELEDYVDQNSSRIADFSEFVQFLPPELQADLGTTQGAISGPGNGEGGHIQGLELATSIPGDLFTEHLTGFGVTFNGAWTDSEVRLQPGTDPITVPGLSETVLNTTLYYERGGFEVRVSNRYRSEFLGEVEGISATRQLRMVQEESIIDAQVGYEFEDGPLEGLSVLAQANNLTDEPFVSFNAGDERQIIDYQQYGATYLVGIAYRF